MPVCNAGDYLKPAVSSILNQQNVTFELIIIDDGSSDNAISQLRPHANLRIISNQGTGLVDALNTGVEAAYFDLIARMDGDDIAELNRLSTQLDYHLKNPQIDIVGAQITLFQDNGDIGKGYAYYQQWINALTEPDDIHQNFFIESPIPHPTAFFRKETIQQLGTYRDTTWPEDYDLWCRAWLAGKQFGKPNSGSLLMWRDHAIRTSRVQQRYSRDQFLQCKIHYLSVHLKRVRQTDCTIWGTGPTGLKVHDYLEQHDIRVTSFIDINPKQIGSTKRGKPVTIIQQHNIDLDITKQQRPLIIAVSARGARQEIETVLIKQDLKALDDYILVA